MQYIAEIQGMYFEGTANRLRLISPPPVILPFELKSQKGGEEFIFLEDYFNSSTRIRRGRLYQTTDQRTWLANQVSWFPYPQFQNAINSVTVNRSYKVTDISLRYGDEVVLGDNLSKTRWIVVLAEKNSLEAHYVTLKSISFLGALPPLADDEIPIHSRQDIVRALNAIVEAAPIQAPQPVIDACRIAAIYMLSAQYPQSNPNGKLELANIIKNIPKDSNDKEPLSVKSAATLINRLHCRTKPNVHKTRTTSIRDADLAVNAIGFMLQDFGWASNE